MAERKKKWIKAKKAEKKIEKVTAKKPKSDDDRIAGRYTRMK